MSCACFVYVCVRVCVCVHLCSLQCWVCTACLGFCRPIRARVAQVPLCLRASASVVSWLSGVLVFCGCALRQQVRLQFHQQARTTCFGRKSLNALTSGSWWAPSCGAQERSRVSCPLHALSSCLCALLRRPVLTCASRSFLKTPCHACPRCAQRILTTGPCLAGTCTAGCVKHCVGAGHCGYGARSGHLVWSGAACLPLTPAGVRVLTRASIEVGSPGHIIAFVAECGCLS